MSRLLPALAAAAALVFTLALPSPLPAAETGSVTGSILVSRTKVKTGGTKGEGDVVVWLESIGPKPPAPRPGRKVQVDQRGLVFIPHVLAVPLGTTVTFLNNDNELHNVYLLNEQTGKQLDLGTWGPNVPVDHLFDEAGPVVTLCKLHLEMAAYIVVLDSPWFTGATLDEATQAGTYTVSGVPPGRYRVEVWHKKLKRKGPAPEVTVEAGKASKADITITKAKYAE